MGQPPGPGTNLESLQIQQGQLWQFSWGWERLHGYQLRMAWAEAGRLTAGWHGGGSEG